MHLIVLNVYAGLSKARTLTQKNTLKHGSHLWNKNNTSIRSLNNKGKDKGISSARQDRTNAISITLSFLLLFKFLMLVPFLFHKREPGLTLSSPGFFGSSQPGGNKLSPPPIITFLLFGV